MASDTAMNLTLSNCDVRAYRKRSGCWSLHLKTAMLLDSNWNFPTDYIDKLKVAVVLPGKAPVQMRCSIEVDGEFEFTEDWTAFTLHLSAVTPWTDLEQCVLRVCVTCDLEFPHGPLHLPTHEQMGVLRKMTL